MSQEMKFQFLESTYVSAVTERLLLTKEIHFHLRIIISTRRIKGIFVGS